MTIRPIGTVCYRLLAEPGLGDGLGNTVYVGISVNDADDVAELEFSGFPRRISTVKAALDKARTPDGQEFDLTLRVRARELVAVMRTGSMKQHDPLLVRGDHLT
jgi:hypothetical protein